MTTSFYFIRHGQTDWNRDKRCHGSTDVRLNDAGREQALHVARILNKQKEHPNIILCSPLMRAVETAEIIQMHLGVFVMKPLIVQCGDLTEACLGILEGNTNYNQNPDSFQDWLKGITVKDAESYISMKTRVNRTLSQLDTIYGPKPLIVAHGNVWKIILERLNLPIERIDNCRLMSIDGGKVTEINEY